MVGTDRGKAQGSPSVEGDGVPGVSCKTRRKAWSGRSEGGEIREPPVGWGKMGQGEWLKGSHPGRSWVAGRTS